MSKQKEIEILKLQTQALQLLLQSEALKEYDADWLTNVKKVVRDSSGKFASKASDKVQEVKDKVQEVKDDVAVATEVAKKIDYKKYSDLITPAVKKSISEVVGVLKKEPSTFEGVKDLVFGAGFKEITGIIANNYKGLSKDIKRVSTQQYKEVEPLLREMKGDEFEQALQDSLIKLNALEKRDLGEDLRDVKSFDDVKKAINNHQAEIISAGVSAATAVALVVGPELVVSLWMAGLDAGGAISLSEVLVDTLTASLASAAAQKGIEPLINNIKDENVKQFLKMMVAVVASSATRVNLQEMKVAREYAKAQAAEAAKAEAELLELARKIGLKSRPKDLQELKNAYRAASKKAHPDAGGSPEQFREVNQAYEALKKQLGL